MNIIEIIALVMSLLSLCLGIILFIILRAFNVEFWKTYEEQQEVNAKVQADLDAIVGVRPNA